MKTILRRFLILLGLLFVALLAFGCGGQGNVTKVTNGGGGETGGSGGGSGGGGGGGGSEVVVIVSQNKSSTFVSGGEIIFSAVVTGATIDTVTWSVIGGDSHGTIDTDGVYLAPSTAGTYTVVATSNEDTSKSDLGVAIVGNRGTFSFFGGGGGGGSLTINDISGDGGTVVGQIGDIPVMWRPSWGFDALPLPTGQTAGEVMATSSTGYYMVGTTWSAVNGTLPTLWTKIGGVQVLSESDSEFDEFQPRGVSDDGRVVVGLVRWEGTYRWKLGEGFDEMVGLTDVFCVSGDGRVAGGEDSGQARIWQDVFGTRDIAPGQGIRVRALSKDGKIIAGESAFGRMHLEINRNLLDFPAEYMHMSKNGKWNLSRSGFWAQRWHASLGFQNIKELLNQNGYVGFLDELTLTKAWISDNGRFMVGRGSVPGAGSQAYFYLTLP